MTSAESCYLVTKIELLAVVWAIKNANTYLAGTLFELIVDHRPLVAITNSKSLDQISFPSLDKIEGKTFIVLLNSGLESRHTAHGCGLFFLAPCQGCRQ